MRRASKMGKDTESTAPPAQLKLASNDQPLKLAIMEKSEDDVSYLWKGCQLFLYIVCITSGFCTSLAIGSINREFNNECVLYANLTVNVANNTMVSPVPHDTHDYSSWGDTRYCSFCQYSPVATVIFAGIWATLFMMCGRGGTSTSNLPQAWRIVPPALLFTLAFVIVSSVTVGYIFGGISSFCSYLIANMEKAGAKISTCDELSEYIWIGHTAGHFYKQVLIAKVSSVFTLIGWIAGLILLIARCATHADFNVLSESEEKTPESETSQLTDTNSSSRIGLISTRDQNPLIAVELAK